MHVAERIEGWALWHRANSVLLRARLAAAPPVTQAKAFDDDAKARATY
jgi:hypothetical protein